MGWDSFLGTQVGSSFGATTSTPNSTICAMGRAAKCAFVYIFAEIKLRLATIIFLNFGGKRLP
ncbi:MAG: hypothetical protein EAY75_14745 [Bacteroidetes bacterium]|nr:MAG: hypothetical protein EAY75_14745 [Bacteroidota bacterium]